MDEHEEDDGYDIAAAEAMEELERRGAPRLAPEPARRPQPPPREEGACVDCGADTSAASAKFHTAFGLHVCYDCQRRFKVSSSPQPGHYPRPQAPDCYLTATRVVSEHGRQVSAAEQDDRQGRVPTDGPAADGGTGRPGLHGGAQPEQPEARRHEALHASAGRGAGAEHLALVVVVVVVVVVVPAAARHAARRLA